MSKHTIVCDTCGKKAKYNLQNEHHLYEVGEDGDYTFLSSWDSIFNSHYCEECAKKEEII